MNDDKIKKILHIGEKIEVISIEKLMVSDAVIMIPVCFFYCRLSFNWHYFKPPIEKIYFSIEYAISIFYSMAFL